MKSNSTAAGSVVVFGTQKCNKMASDWFTIFTSLKKSKTCLSDCIKKKEGEHRSIQGEHLHYFSGQKPEGLLNFFKVKTTGMKKSLKWLKILGYKFPVSMDLTPDSIYGISEKVFKNRVYCFFNTSL